MSNFMRNDELLKEIDKVWIEVVFSRTSSPKNFARRAESCTLSSNFLEVKNFRECAWLIKELTKNVS